MQQDASTGDHERAAAFTVHQPGQPVSITAVKMESTMNIYQYSDPLLK